jgi:alpha-tubulin suppressor-like RCC1 family protein
VCGFISPFSGLVKISAYHSHACAINSTKQLFCWGNRAGGKIGNGTSTGPQETPAHVPGLWTSVAAGMMHTCGIREDAIPANRVFCWGDQTDGQLGNGANAGPMPYPVSTSDDTPYLKISAGSTHSCGLRNDFSLTCWGNNSYGKIGTGSVTPTFHSIPVTINP